MEAVTKFLGIVALLIVLGFVLALPIMWLWNWLMPEIFGLVEISFLQAFGLNMLSGFLIKNTNSK